MKTAIIATAVVLAGMTAIPAQADPNVQKLSPYINIDLIKVGEIPIFTEPDQYAITYKVTNNSDTDFNDITFECNIFKKDGSFDSIDHVTFLNVQHGLSEYGQGFTSLNVAQFGRSECRLVDLATFE